MKSLASIASAFQIAGEIQSIRPLGKGQINDTFLVTSSQAKYVLQAINPAVFPDTAAVMHNMNLVLQQLAKSNSSAAQLQLISRCDGQGQSYFHKGRCWRMTNFLEGLLSLDRVENAEIAYAAAKGYGRFFRQLLPLSPQQLQITLPAFHDVAKRFEQLDLAIVADAAGRLSEVNKEVAAYREWRTAVLAIFRQSQQLPLRITHNDTKISNVLLRPNSYEAVAVIDLDTVMPGSVLFDVGDMIRTFVSPADEEAEDLRQVYVRRDILEALLEGYLSETANYLLPAEQEKLIDGGKMLIFTQFTRFLADYLQGDVYYRKITYAQQNLVRARNQLHLFLDLMRVCT